MMEETLTINRSQLVSWASSPRAHECLWESLKQFLAEDAEFFLKLAESATTKPSTDREAIVAEILQACTDLHVEPYTFHWDAFLGSKGKSRTLEVVLFEHPPLEFQHRVKDILGPEVEVYYSVRAESGGLDG